MNPALVSSLNQQRSFIEDVRARLKTDAVIFSPSSKKARRYMTIYTRADYRGRKSERAKIRKITRSGCIKA